jgi:lipoprotein-releasing system permease protein
MNVFTDIARRYLFSKKSTNAINIITSISVLGISIGTAAMILILSVFNGFESLIKEVVDDFNPDIKLQLVEGKRFNIDDTLMTKLIQLEGVEAVSKTIEEVALFEYNGIQEAGIIKGVDDMFPVVTSIDSTLNDGNYIVKDENAHYAVTGYGLARKLSMNIDDFSTSLILYLPKRKKKTAFEKDVIVKEILPSAFFSIENEKDHQYVLTSLSLIEGLLKTNGQINALEIKLNSESDEELVRSNISELMGPKFETKNRYEQEETYFKVMNIEKYMSLLIGTLTILLIAFNLVGSLWMIVLEKKKDIAILKSMGSTRQNILGLFLKEGVLITILGVILGIIISVIIYYIQIKYGIIAMAGSHIVQAYPIELRIGDILLVMLIVSLIGFLAAVLPAKKAAEIPALIREE